MKRDYVSLFRTLDSLLEGETDHIAVMATVAAELYAFSDQFNWVGFYRNIGGEVLKIGPYQGGHGCLRIPFEKGVCGKCAREQKVQNVPDVNAAAHHIACSSTTKSEIVVPIMSGGKLIAVLDIDSDDVGAFDAADEEHLLKITKYF